MTLSRAGAVDFIAQLLTESRRLGLAPERWLIDHVCYRVATKEEYEKACAFIGGGTGDLTGRLLSEAPIAGRPIATFRLSSPLATPGCLVEAIEIPAPNSNRAYPTGFEHIEVVVTEPLSTLRSKHGDLPFAAINANPLNPELTLRTEAGTIKFHHLPLSCVIGVENHPTVWQALTSARLLETLAPWQALISGSIPIDVHGEKSDLDILLSAPDIDQAAAAISEALPSRPRWEAYQSRQGPALVAELELNDARFELFLSSVPVLEQHSHRHLLAEYQLLVEHGEPLRQQVRSLKRQGYTTEEAFAKALHIDGNPYTELLRHVNAP